MSDYSFMSGQQLAILASAIAALLSEGLTVDEQNILGNFITAMGAALLTIAAAEAAQSPSETVVG